MGSRMNRKKIDEEWIGRYGIRNEKKNRKGRMNMKKRDEEWIER